MVIERSNWIRVVLIAAATAVAVTACGRSPAVKFYTLSPTQIPATTAGNDLLIAVGPAEFPRTLKRNQIVTRTSTAQVTIDEFNLWSAPLELDFLRVLGDNIAATLGTDRVVTYPAVTPLNIDYRVALQVSQFDGVLGEGVTLNARWTILHSGKAVASGTFSDTQVIAAGDRSYDGLVAAHNAAIGMLSQAITAQLQELGKPAND